MYGSFELTSVMQEPPAGGALLPGAGPPGQESGHCHTRHPQLARHAHRWEGGTYSLQSAPDPDPKHWVRIWTQWGPTIP